MSLVTLDADSDNLAGQPRFECASRRIGWKGQRASGHLYSGEMTMPVETTLQRLITQFNEPRKEFDGQSYVTRRREWFDKPMEVIEPLLREESLESCMDLFAFVG